MSATVWGTSRLRNAGGTWVQRWTGGIAAGGDVHHVYGTYKGTGGYAGLVAHESGWFVEAGEGFTSDIQMVGAGWIETTDGSPVPPAPGPGTTPANWTPVVGIATLKNTAYRRPRPLGPRCRAVRPTPERAAGELLRGDRHRHGPTEASTIAFPPPGATRTAPGSPPPPPPRWCAALARTSSTSSTARPRAQAPTRGSRITTSRTTRNPSRYVPGDTFVLSGWIEEEE